MTTNNSTISQSQYSRSSSEIATVYRKLAGFYFYDLFLQKGSYLLLSFYLISILFPLSFFLLVKKDFAEAVSRIEEHDQKGNPPLADDEQFKLGEANEFIVKALQNAREKYWPWFSVLLIGFKSFLSCPNQVLNVSCTYSFPFTVASSVPSTWNFYSLKNKDISLEEELIISSVKNIKPYDIIIFEFIYGFLIHSLYLVLSLGFAFIIPVHGKLKVLRPLFSVFLPFFRLLSSSDSVSNIIIFIWQVVELSPELGSFFISPKLVLLIRISLPIFSFLYFLYQSFLKIIKFRG